jgi:hypothetical protein
MFRIAAVWFQFGEGGGLPDIPVLESMHVKGVEDSKFTRLQDHRVGSGSGK